MPKTRVFSLIAFSVFIIALETVSGPIHWVSGVLILNTYVSWILNFIILFIWFKGIRLYTNKRQIRSMMPLQILLLWYVFSIIRGVFIADDYWTAKVLVNNTFGLLLPVAAYALTNLKVLKALSRVYLQYTLPLFLFFIFIIPRDTLGRYLMLVSILFLFFPVFSKRIKWVVVVFTLIALTADITARGKTLTFAIPVLLVVGYYYRHFIPKILWEWIRKILMIAPIVLFTLAITGVFNVFKMEEYIQGDYTAQSTKDGELTKENLLADSRTFLYKEVLLSALVNNYWLIGRSPARGNDTVRWESQTEISGRNERFGNETGILNIFTWTGIIGVILYFLVFYRATYLAVNKSNNIFSKMIGVSLAFRWLWSWVTEFSSFDLSYLSIWILVAFSFSENFRSMTNNEVKYWIRGITDKRYK
ncbi:hypothetical protein N9H40_00475 [bacterium]|nr:hypothetical protein [bacterium]